MGMVAEDIAQMIAEAELAYTAVGTDVFIGSMPDSPDDLCRVSPTTGRAPDLTTEMEVAGIQIMVRNSVFQTGYNAVNDLMKYLHRQVTPEISTTTRTYYFMEVLGSPTYIGQDKKQRHLFSLNMNIYTDTTYSV